MFRRVAVTALLALGASVDAFAPSFGARLAVAPRGALSRAVRPRAAPGLRMQEEDATAVQEFTKDGQPLTLLAKEKLYLDSCAAFNVDGESIISDDDFELLKTDLTFEGSQVMLMSREEIKFMVAKSRYTEGKPFMPDDEFDALRQKLKKKGSFAVLHEAAACRVNSDGNAICKTDLFADDGKNAILYAPALVLSALLFNEWAFWFKGWDPILSLILGTPFIVAATYTLTNFIYFQSPFVAKAVCPECSTPQNIYFGDILFVSGKPVSNEVQTVCTNKACGVPLVAYKDRMVVESTSKK